MADNNGITGGLQTTLPIAMTISAFTAIAWYNVIDLNVLIWLTFKRRHGLYFYSLLGSSWGIMIYALAFLMKFFQVWKNDYISVALITIGWYAMVTGQSLVLYSRLHLVVRDTRKIKWVLYMIILDVFLFHFPTTVLTFGANSSKANIFATPYSIMEKIQVTAFCIQEFIISGLYVYSTQRMLKPGETFQKKRTRQIMLHLIYVNIFIILMDIALLCTEYANLYEIQITFKGAVYSVKLRLEFVVLNQLRSLAVPQDGSHENQIGIYHHSLGTVNNQNIPVRSQVNEHVSENYTCGASKQDQSPFAGKMDNRSVMMTREVLIEREEFAKDDIDNKGRESQASIRKTNDVYENPSNPSAKGWLNRPKTTPSPTSSELEFAGAGY